MRKQAYCIANLIMKALGETHAFRYICFYKLQIILSHFYTLLSIVLVGKLLNIWQSYLIILPVFYVSKLIFNVKFHATSFLGCGVMTTIMLATLGIITIYIDFRIGIALTILMNLCLSLNIFTKELTMFSFSLDKIMIKLNKKRR